MDDDPIDDNVSRIDENKCRLDVLQGEITELLEDVGGFIR